MKNKKIILLILVMLVFSGCSVKYNLNINEDLSVNEKIIASESTTSLKIKTGQEPKVAANSLYDSYKIKGVKYNISTTSNNRETTSNVSTSFKSLEDYVDYFESDIIKEVNITEKDGYITLEYKQDVPLTEYSSRSLVYDSIEVNLIIPFKVTENNADKVNGNTYTWNIKKDGKLKDIKITFNKNETNSSKKINFFGFFEINVKYSVLFVCGIVLLIILILLVVYTKNKKNNRF